VLAGLALVLLAGCGGGERHLTTNTIDPLASHKQDGRLVQVTGPSGCTRGERVSITVAVRQPATAAQIRPRAVVSCCGPWSGFWLATSRNAMAQSSWRDNPVSANVERVMTRTDRIVIAAFVLAVAVAVGTVVVAVRSPGGQTRTLTRSTFMSRSRKTSGQRPWLQSHTWAPCSRGTRMSRAGTPRSALRWSCGALAGPVFRGD
jgi:hypothetical protein